MGVGAGLYMCDVVKKVHVRYLISWWVLVTTTTTLGPRCRHVEEILLGFAEAMIIISGHFSGPGKELAHVTGVCVYPHSNV